MTLIIYKTLAAILIFLISMAMAFYPLKKKKGLHATGSIELGEALASGIFLGTAFFHMLPDAIRIFAQHYSAITYPIPEAICVGGFLMMLFLERLSLTQVRGVIHSVPYILAIILMIHAITEGAALGLGGTLSETIMIFIAILAHKGSESFALCITLLKHQLSFTKIIYVIFFFALMTPLGISLGTLMSTNTDLHHGEIIEAFFNAFAAGTFLYISTLHPIHFHKHANESQGLIEFICLTVGLITMGIIAVWA